MEASRRHLIDIRWCKPDSIWPTPAQLSLLRAALWSGDEARTAWTDWRDSTDLKTIDPSSWNLLPLVWRNLSAQGMNDPVLTECRGYYRYHWAKNQVLLSRAGGWVAAWQNRGIPVVVLKGAALAVDYYGEMGLRPMSDVDLLVPLEKVQEAAGWLQAEGWKPQLSTTEWARVRLEEFPGFNWQRGLERIDLHWHVLHRCTDPVITAEFWTRVQPFQLGGTETKRLCPEDMLLNVCGHGMQKSDQAPFRWLADATMILRRAGPRNFDWNLLVAMARRSGSTLPLRLGLEFAAAEIRLPVPGEVLAALRKPRSTWSERLAYCRTTGEGRPWERAWLLVEVLHEASGKGSWGERGRRVYLCLCQRWDVSSPGQLFLRALSLAWNGRPKVKDAGVRPAADAGGAPR